MTSAAQRKANQQNAQHSTGPRTAEGKQRTSLNALKHGFRAKDPLIPGEDPDEFHRHGAELLLELAPMTAVEQNLVGQIIDITWRLKRFPRIEAAVINELYDTAAAHPFNDDKDGEQLLGKALARDQSLNRLSRYEAQLARRYHNVMKELRELRKQRRHRGILSTLAAGSKAEANEPTHSNVSAMESTLPGNPSTDAPHHEPGTIRPSTAGAAPTPPQTPAGTANQEAAA